MWRHVYGPDILHKVKLDKLEGLGIPAGNVLCLREASLPWVTGPLAKQLDLSPEQISSLPGRVSKKQHLFENLVEYEKQWYNDAGDETGSSRVTGQIMALSDEE